MTDTMTTASRWYRRFHPFDTAPARLVCFPHAGGAAGYYHPLSAALAPYADVLVAQYPGRQDRFTDPLIPSIDGLADHLFRELRPFADRPLTFFGHSMGAVLAFEVARRFERAGTAGPVRLFLSGRRAPALHRDEPLAHLLPDDELFATLTELGGTDAQLIADPELRALILPSLRSDYTAIETYRAEPGAVVSAPITGLSGDADPRVSPAEVAQWARHTTAGCELEVFPGGHFYLVEQAPAVAALLVAHFTGGPAVTRSEA
ncbi:thioesterase II family protein [Kitasatospora sp. NPDC004240]